MNSFGLANTRGLFSRIQLNAFTSIPIAPLVYIRIIFSALLLREGWLYYQAGWLHEYYVKPIVYFAYYGMDWVRPLPPDWMMLFFLALGGVLFCVMIGFLYRVMMPLFFLGFTYIFLIDQSNYLNQHYLIVLLSFLMIFIPAHRAFSIDALLRPKTRANTAPAWTLYILCFQVAVVYFFGGIAKLNSDWLHGEPMGMWLAQSTDFPVIGRFFTEKWMVYAFAYGGICVDLFGLPLLLIKRTRWLGLALLMTFHLLNNSLFGVRIFPILMIALLPLFFPVRWWEKVPLRKSASPQMPTTHPRWRLVLALLAIYCAFQLTFPLRHFIIPGNVSWTEEGEKFSWHMKLRDKRAIITYIIVQPSTGDSWEELPEDYLTDRQMDFLPKNPDGILQFAHYLSTLWDDVEVYADVRVSLNGRDYSPLVDPNINLAAEPRRWGRSEWLLPLTTPLNQRRRGLVG